MKRKSLLFLLLMALFAPLAMNGQQTATFNNGTTTNSYVPFYGGYADYGAKGQFIIPASDLESQGVVSGCQISKLTFYNDDNGTAFGTSRVVEVGEVSNSTFSSASFVTTGLITVLSGNPNTLTVSGGTMEVSFSSNYTYSGGNLVISIGGYGSNCFWGDWYGVEIDGASVYGYNQSSGVIPTSAKAVLDFAPKTTITYIQGNTPYITLAPTEATVLTGFTETLTASYGNVSGTPTITYTSSNTSVATVSGSGTTATVTGVAPGTATITATMNGSYTATCTITVEDPSYCTPNPSSVDGKGITAVTFGTDDVVNNSNSNGLPASSPYYGDYTSMVGSSEAGETVTVAITYSTGSSTVYSYGTLIWVDWNKNYTFEDSEIVYTGTSAQGSNGTPQVLTATFTVPATQAADDYRMRIAGADSYFDSYIGGSTSANHSPCFSSTYAVCHDYTLRVTPASNCKKPTDLAATNVTKNSATLSWIENGEATAWNISVNGTVTPNVTNPYNLTGLTPETSYTVKVSPVCEDERWSDEITFTTLVACPAPTNVTVNLVTNNSAEISFDGADSYNIRYCTMTETSYDFEDGSWSGWSTIDNDGDDYAWVVTDQQGSTTGGSATVESHGGDYYVVSSYNEEALAENWLISPQINLGGSINFYIKRLNNSNYDDYYRVYLSTTGTSISDFTVEIQGEREPATSYEFVTIDLSNYSGSGYVAIKHYAKYNDQAYIFIDDVTILEPSSWQYTNDLTLTGLDAETEYEVQVQADCGSEDGTSAWVGTTFTTLDNCALPYELNATNLTGATATLNWTGAQEAYNVRYHIAGEKVEEGFEGGSIPEGWAKQGSTWTVGQGAGTSTLTSTYEGSYNVKCSHSSTDDDYYLIMPALDLSGASNLNLSLYYANPYYSSSYEDDIDGFGVYYRVNEGEWNELFYTTEKHNTWTPLTVALTGLAANYQIGFRMHDNWGGGVAIDNISLVISAGGEWVTKTNVTSPLNINDLTPTIENGNHYLPINYEWQVQGINCDGNGTATDWSAPATFTTPEGYFKHITGYGTGTGNWYLIASPIGTIANNNLEEKVINIFSNSYDLFYFDQAKENEWVNYKPNESGTSTNPHFGLETGKGYLYANSNDVDLVFTGAAHVGTNQDGTETVKLAYTSGEGIDLPGWNLVGNPFAETAYLAGNRGFYTMDEDGIFTPVTNASIEAMEGIFVVAEGSNESVTFTTSEPTKGGNLALNLSNGRKAIDRAIVRFDGGRQLPKLQLFGERTKLYIPVEGQDYAIVNATEMGEMPVSFKAESNGSYTLSFNAEEVSFAYLHLIDNLTGADIDLLETPSYSFEAKTTDYESRFKLVFATGNNSNDDDFAFFSNGSFVINNEGNAELQVVDVMGRIVKSESINGCANVSVNGAAGVYMLRLVNGDNVKVQKVVVK